MHPRILVIEDNEQNLYLVRFLIENAGWHLVAVRSGAEALARIDEVAPDLVLLDIQLPDLDGYEVCRRLRQSIAGATVPIVAVTSYAMKGDREAAIEAGCDGYIEKPIDPETFISQLSPFLDGRDSGQGGAP